MQFPNVQLVRGARFVEAGNLASSGGLSSGIDLSLRVVERYFGRDVASRPPTILNIRARAGWIPIRIRFIARDAPRRPTHPLCPVCDMEVDPAVAPQSTYAGKTYYFCMSAHKVAFDKGTTDVPGCGDELGVQTNRLGKAGWETGIATSCDLTGKTHLRHAPLVGRCGRRVHPRVD